MVETVLAYAAGIFDGEGSVSLVRSRISRWPSPQTSVASNDLEVLDWLRSQFSGSISTKQPRKPTHHVSYDWKLTDRKALLFLQSIRPYVRIHRKQVRIDLLLEAYLQSTPRNGRYTVEIAQRKQELIDTFRSLP